MSNIILREVSQNDLLFLFKLLKERNPIANISHKNMPSFKEHKNFVLSQPYSAWYVIYVGNKKIGSIYLSKQDEIGIFFKKDFMNQGFGNQALTILITKHPRKRYLANLNPKNDSSKKFFKKHNFKLIQHTYELTKEEL